MIKKQQRKPAAKGSNFTKGLFLTSYLKREEVDMELSQSQLPEGQVSVQ